MQKIEMKNKITSIDEINKSHGLVEENKNSLNTLVYSIVTSFRAGTFGFAIVLTLIIITKFLAFSTGAKDVFLLDLSDLAIASWGFIILSFSKFISFQKK